MIHIYLSVLAAAIIALALFVWLARPERLVNKWFAAHAISLALWITGVAGLHAGNNLENWGRFTFAASCLVPPTFLGLIRAYPTAGRWPSQRTLSIALTLGALFAASSLLTELVVYGVSFDEEGLSRNTGPLYPLLSIYLLLTIVAALAVFVSKWRRAAGMERAQLQYLGAGLIIPVIGGATTNLLLPLLTGRSTYSWLGPYFSFVMLAVIGHAIIRHRLMDLRLVINKGAVYVLLITLLSLAAILTVRYTDSSWMTDTDRTPLRVNLLITALVAAAVLSAPGQALLNRAIDPYLRRGRLDHVSALRAATRALSRLMQPRELAHQLRDMLRNAFLPESFAMILIPARDVNKDVLFTSNEHIIDLVFTSEAVARFVESQPSPSVITINPDLADRNTKDVHELLRSAGVELIISLGRRGSVLGAIFVGPQQSGNAYFTADLGFLESLSELASIALENALLYRQQEHMLEYSNHLLASLASGVIAVDVDGRIASFNSAATQLLELADDSSGRELGVLPSEVGWALALTIRRSWLPREVQANIDHSRRGALPVMLSAAALHDDHDEVIGALVVITDVSTVKALERNQRRVEHLAMMARFYAGIAHEIRSPLASISNFISMLPDRFDDPEYRDTAARLLPMEVNRIVRLADRLRLMAPSEDGKLISLALPPLLRDVVAIHASTAQDQGISVRLYCSDDVPSIMADPGQLVQLLVNLLKNGMESMPTGGVLAIRCVHRPAGNSVIIEVIDEGLGISSNIQSQIFQPFFTTKPTGTGLGLAICKEIADFHKARLTLSNRPSGPGTVAQVEFLDVCDRQDAGTALGLKASGE